MIPQKNRNYGFIRLLRTILGRQIDVCGRSPEPWVKPPGLIAERGHRSPSLNGSPDAIGVRQRSLRGHPSPRNSVGSV